MLGSVPLSLLSVCSEVPLHAQYFMHEQDSSLWTHCDPPTHDHSCAQGVVQEESMQLFPGVFF